MCWKIVTSDLPVFDPIDKKFLLQNVIKTRTKTINVTKYENDVSVLEFPNHVAKIHQVVSTKITGRACFEIKRNPTLTTLLIDRLFDSNDVFVKCMWRKQTFKKRKVKKYQFQTCSRNPTSCMQRRQLPTSNDGATVSHICILL